MQAVAGDSSPRLDSSGYRRYCLQKFARILETPCRVLLKEFLKENYDWLWNIFESLKR